MRKGDFLLVPLKICLAIEKYRPRNWSKAAKAAAGTALAAAAFLAIAVAMTWAQGGREGQHDPREPGHFYTSDCCGLNDCRVAKEGEVTLTSNGFHVVIKEHKIDRMLPFNSKKVRQIPRKHNLGQYHVCIQAHLVGAWLQCLYIPILYGT